MKGGKERGRDRRREGREEKVRGAKKGGREGSEEGGIREGRRGGNKLLDFSPIQRTALWPQVPSQVRERKGPSSVHETRCDILLEFLRLVRFYDEF